MNTPDPSSHSPHPPGCHGFDDDRPPGWPPFLREPGPRDWPEDATRDPDNGSYSHRCIHCGHTFVGHKRRPNVCKVCAGEGEAKAKRRADFLSAHRAPGNWTVQTTEEVNAAWAQYTTLLWELDEERRVRRKLTEAAIPALGWRVRCPLSDAIEESRALDAKITSHEAARRVIQEARREGKQEAAKTLTPLSPSP